MTKTMYDITWKDLKTGDEIVKLCGDQFTVKRCFPEISRNFFNNFNIKKLSFRNDDTEATIERIDTND